MLGRTFMAATALGVCAVAACCVVPALGSATAARGGNHGCSEEEGFVYSDHWFESGDNISFGYQFDPGAGTPSEPDQDDFSVMNVSSAGGTPSAFSCVFLVDTVTSVRSNLGAGNDSVRLDGKGVPPDEDGAFGSIPKAIDSFLTGGAGDDTIRGHAGTDIINAGTDDDTVKADDGKFDIVKCGKGDDKADIDSKDAVQGCEKKT